MTDAAFVRFLVDRGLHAAGSSETMLDLAKRHGVTRWFEFSDVVYLPAAPLFPEQKAPFFFTTEASCLLPPYQFDCDFDVSGDGPRNHSIALERLSQLLGTPQTGISINTLEHTWTFERSWLRILTFLRQKTHGSNPLYQRHPELWNYCRISIDCARLRAMQPSDASALHSLSESEILPIGNEPVSGPGRRQFLTAPERGLFLLDRDARLTPPGATGFLWRRGSHVGWCANQLAAIFERGHCQSLRLLRGEPARSCGYSTLLLRLRNPFSLEQESIQTKLLDGKGAQDLNDAARRVSRFWELPLDIEDFLDD